jgi:hypothetical protein
VGSKLDEKIKAGDMKESELLEEASELMKKMKNMPGMGDLQGMLNKMGMNKGKVNVDAMQSNINQKLKETKNRERLLKKLAEKKMQQAAQAAQAQAAQAQVEQPAENLVFSTGEKAERSTREQKKKKNKK